MCTISKLHPVVTTSITRAGWRSRCVRFVSSTSINHDKWLYIKQLLYFIPYFLNRKCLNFNHFQWKKIICNIKTGWWFQTFFMFILKFGEMIPCWLIFFKGGLVQPVTRKAVKLIWYPQIIHFNRVFHYKPSILGGTTIFGNTHMDFFRQDFAEHLLDACGIQQPWTFELLTNLDGYGDRAGRLAGRRPTRVVGFFVVEDAMKWQGWKWKIFESVDKFSTWHDWCFRDVYEMDWDVDFVPMTGWSYRRCAVLPTFQNVWDRWLFNLTNFKLGVLVI